MTYEHELDEALDWPTVAGLLAAIGVGLPAGIGAVRGIRNIKALLQSGKETAAEKAWNKLSQSDQRALDAILKREAKKLGESEDLDEAEALEWEEIDLAHDTLIEAWERDPEMLDPYIDEFEVLVAEGEFEMALELLEQAEPLMVDEYQRMTTGARMKRMRARRTGITQEVRKGKKTRTEIKRANRKARRRYRTDMQAKLQAKRYRRRTKRRQARRRPLPGRSTNESLVDQLLEARRTDEASEYIHPSPHGESYSRDRDGIHPHADYHPGGLAIEGGRRDHQHEADFAPSPEAKAKADKARALWNERKKLKRKLAAKKRAAKKRPVSEAQPAPVGLHRFRQKVEPVLGRSITDDEATIGCCYVNGDHRSVHRMQDRMGHTLTDRFVKAVKSAFPGADGHTPVSEHHQEPAMSNRPQSLADKLIEYAWAEGNRANQLALGILEHQSTVDESEAVVAMGDGRHYADGGDIWRLDGLRIGEGTEWRGEQPPADLFERPAEDIAEWLHEQSEGHSVSRVRTYLTLAGPGLANESAHLQNVVTALGLLETMEALDAAANEANDDKTDDLSAKKEGEIKKLAKEYGAIKVTQKGPSINATFDDQKKAQSFKKAAQAKGGETAMRRSGDDEYTVHIDEGALDEGALDEKSQDTKVLQQLRIHARLSPIARKTGLGAAELAAKLRQHKITAKDAAASLKTLASVGKVTKGAKGRYVIAEEELDEGKGLKVQCGECGKVFATKSDYPKCPKCKSTDIDLAEAASFGDAIDEAYEFLSEVELLDEAGDPAAQAYKMLKNADKALVGRLRDGLAKLTKAVREAQRGQETMEKKMGVGATTARDQLGIIVKELRNYEALVRRMVQSADGLTEAEEVLELDFESGFLTEASGAELFAKIKAGTRVTIRTPHGQERSGKAVMRGPHGWVLNMGGKHGTPGIASPENIVKVGKDRVSESMRSIRDAIDEQLDEAAPKAVTLSMSDQIDMNRAPQGEITPEIHAWASKKFGKGASATISSAAHSKAKGRIEIHKPKGRMGTTTVTVTRRGNHLIVKDDQGGGIDTKPKVQFFELRESADEAYNPNAMGGGKLGVYSDYQEARDNAEKIAKSKTGRTVGVGIEKRKEYGKTVYTVKFVPKDPSKRQGHELRMEIVEDAEPLDERYLEDYGEVRRGSMGYVVVSKEEWKKKHRDFKLTPKQSEDGRRKMMFLSRKSGTVLAPVLVVGVDKMTPKEKAALVEDVSETTMPVPPPDDPGEGFNRAIAERAGRATTTREEALRIYWIAAHRELMKLAESEAEVCAFLNSKRGYDFGRVVCSNFGALGDEGSASTDPKKALGHIRLAIREMGEEALMADINALGDLGGDDAMEEAFDDRKAVTYARSFRHSYGRKDLEQMLKAEKDRLRKGTAMPKDIKDYAKLTIRALELALGDDSAVESLDEEVYSLGGGGMKRIDNLPLHVAPGSFYGFGGSSSPDTVIVTKVSGDTVTYTKGPGFTTERREQMAHFLGLADHGTRQWLKLYGNYMDPKLKRTLEANLQGKAGPMNGKVKVKDEQKVRVDVEAAKLKPGEDLYYALESIGSITGHYGEDPVTKKDRGSAHVRRGDIPKIRKDPRFKVLKVHSKPYSYGMGESAEGGVFEAAIVVGDKARVIGLYSCDSLDEAEKLARAALPVTAPSLDEDSCEIRVHERLGSDGLVNEDALDDCTTVVPLDEFTSAGVPAMAPMDAMLLRMVSPEELEDDEDADGDSLDEATKVTDGASLTAAIVNGDVESDIPHWMGRAGDYGYLKGKKIETDPKFKGRKVERTWGRGKGQFGTMTGRKVWTYGGVGNAYEVRLDNRTILWSPDIKPVGWKVENGKVVDVTESLDERGDAHDSMVAFFIANSGKSWRAGQVAAQLGISNAEAFKQLSRLVREGTLLFKRGSGYSLNTAAAKGSIQIPADLDARSMRSAIRRHLSPSRARRGYDSGMVEDLDEARMFDAAAYEACKDLAVLARASIDGDGGIEQSYGHGGFDAAACFPATTPKGMAVRVTVAHHTDEDALYLILHGDRDSYTSPYAVTVGTFAPDDAEPGFDALLDAMEGYDFECELLGLQESINDAPDPDAWPEWADWSPEERIVFLYTVSLKAGYGGDKDFRFKEAHKETKITADEWERGKAGLIKRKAFNRGGAVMPAVKKRYYAHKMRDYGPTKSSWPLRRRNESLDETRSTNAAGFLPSNVFSRGDGGGQGPVNYEYGLTELEQPRNKGREGGIRDDGPDTKKGPAAVFSEDEEAVIADLIESGLSRDDAIEALGLDEGQRMTKAEQGIGVAAYRASYREWRANPRTKASSRPLASKYGISPAQARKIEAVIDRNVKAGGSGGKYSGAKRREVAPGQFVVEAAELDGSVELLFVDDQYVVVVPDGGTEYRFDPDEYGQAIAKGEEVAAANQWAFVDNSHLGMPSDISDSIDEAKKVHAVVVTNGPEKGRIVDVGKDAAEAKRIAETMGKHYAVKVNPKGIEDYLRKHEDLDETTPGSVNVMAAELANFLTHKPRPTAKDLQDTYRLTKSAAAKVFALYRPGMSWESLTASIGRVISPSMFEDTIGDDSYAMEEDEADLSEAKSDAGKLATAIYQTLWTDGRQIKDGQHLFFLGGHSGLARQLGVGKHDTVTLEKLPLPKLRELAEQRMRFMKFGTAARIAPLLGMQVDKAAKRIFRTAKAALESDDLDEAWEPDAVKVGDGWAPVRRQGSKVEYMLSAAKAQSTGKKTGKGRWDPKAKVTWTPDADVAVTKRNKQDAMMAADRVVESLDEAPDHKAEGLAVEITRKLLNDPRATAKDLQDAFRLTPASANTIAGLDRTMDKDRLTVAVQRATKTLHEDEETEEVAFAEEDLQSFTLAAEAVGLSEDTEFTVRDGLLVASVPASQAAQLRELAEVAG